MTLNRKRGDFEHPMCMHVTMEVMSVVDKTVNISLDTTQYLENDSNLCSNCLFSVLLRVKIAEITSQLMRLL